jgi:hypothetical protein
MVDHAHEAIDHSSGHSIYEKQFFHLIHLVIKGILHCSVFALEEVEAIFSASSQQGHKPSMHEF